MSKLSLYFLGPPRIERNGQPVETDTRKAIALLAYLALTHQRPFRDHLATLLWPEYDDSHAKAALRRTLSTLKKAVGDGIISSNRDTIWLEPNTIGCDALQFQQLLSPAPPHPCTPAQLETAVSLYHSDFLTGFTLRDSLPFDDWQQQQAEHLRRQLSHVLEQLAHHYGQQQQYDRALSHAHRQAALHNNLADLHHAAGQHEAAMHHLKQAATLYADISKLGTDWQPEI